MNYLKRMKELKGQQVALLGLAKTENRCFTDEEKGQFEAMTTEIASCEAMIAATNQVGPEPAPAAAASDDTPRIEIKNEKKWKGGFGEFLNCVRVAGGPSKAIDQRLLDVRNQLGLNEGVGSEGGFLVETEHSQELLRRTYELGALTSRVRKIGVGPNANGLTINAVGENSRATGSRWGGVQAYWLNEAGPKTPSMPAFRQIELKLKKLIGLCYATDELLMDTPSLESIINQAFMEEFSWMLDNAVLRGVGAAQPLGILNSAALIPVPAEAGQAAGTIVYENVLNMWSRMWARSRQNAVWFINQDCEPQLATMGLVVGVGGIPVYMPAGGASGAPYATLFGRPIIPVEQCSTVGTVGDIVLADLSQYLMIEKGGMQTASSIHVRFVNDESVYRFVYRCDGGSMWNLPLTPANGTNTLSPFIALATRP